MEEITQSTREENQIKVLVIGSKEHIMSTIYRLYKVDFAEVYEWSKIIPAPNSNKMMSVLTIDIR